MRPLDAVLPSPRLLEIDSVEVAAPSDRVWNAVRHGDLGNLSVVRALFAIRTRSAESVLRVDELVSTPEQPGFQILIDDPPCSFVVGAIGKVWKLDIPFVHVPDAAAFASFDEPGEVKVAWSISVLPLSSDRSHVTIEVRVDATDDASWNKFRAYFAVIGPASRLIRALLLRSLARELSEGPTDWRDVASGIGGAAIMAAAFLTPFLRNARSHWGLEEADALRARPGDELVPEPRWQWTHAVEIERPCEEVWPWIAQIGADRAGFYSYEWLENVVGCQLRNAEAIHPEWAITEGGELSLHPKMPPLRVVSVAKDRGFVAYAPADDAARTAGKPWATVTWAFLLEPLGPRRCRVVSRYRCATSEDIAMRLSLGPSFVEPIGFAMDRRMLLGIKRRAERRPAS